MLQQMYIDKIVKTQKLMTSYSWKTKSYKNKIKKYYSLCILFII